MEFRDLRGRFAKPRKVITRILAIWVLASSIYTGMHIIDIFQNKTVVANGHQSYEDWLEEEVDWRMEHDPKTQEFVRNEVESAVRMATNVQNASTFDSTDEEIINRVK